MVGMQILSYCLLLWCWTLLTSLHILASVIRFETIQVFCPEFFSLSSNVKEAGWLAAGGLVGLIKPRQLEEVQVSVPTGSTLSLHSANQKALQLHQHVPLAQPTTNSHLSLQHFKETYFSLPSLENESLSQCSSK